MAVKINSIDKSSPAAKANISSGASLLSINGNEINDMLDYEFYQASQHLQLAVMMDGSLKYIDIDKSEYEPLGCAFERYLIDNKHSCKNHCMFCFIDQLPSGMRDTLYFKDDDERLSFLFGNYVTLTNFSEREVNRIKQMNISPINISVHTMDADLRVRMMANKSAGDVLRYIYDFAKADIKMNCQLVLCRDVNDADYLRDSLEKLGELYPAVQSIAAVPSGLTRYRDRLCELKPYNKESACAVLDILEEYGSRFKAMHGTRLVYPGDEWYLLAQRPMPDGDFYDEYLQLENGVGMWRMFHDEFMAELELPHKQLFKKRLNIATGELAYPLIALLARRLESKYPKIKIKVHAIKNDFFGGNVSVAGLVTGTDLKAQLKGKLQGHTLCIPTTMLREEKDKFLDDVSVRELAKHLKCRIKLLPQDGAQMLIELLK